MVAPSGWSHDSLRIARRQRRGDTTVRIGLLSDTHGHYDAELLEFFDDVDEVWHAGDFGTIEVADRLAEFRPLRGVFGNVDGLEVRDRFPEHERFVADGIDVWITHIGGYPGRYDRRVRASLRERAPDLFICGHSHVVRAQRDPQLGLLHLNPGAAGHQGFHTLRTMMRFDIVDGAVQNLKLIELGPRGRAADERHDVS